MTPMLLGSVLVQMHIYHAIQVVTKTSRWSACSAVHVELQIDGIFNPFVILNYFADLK